MLRLHTPLTSLTSHNIELVAAGVDRFNFFLFFFFDGSIRSGVSLSFRRRPGGDMASRETLNELGCSSSEEDSGRAEVAREEKTSPPARRHHPFSVEALMSGRKTDTRGEESKPEAGSVVVSPTCLNSLYMCRETCSPPAGSGRSFPAAPSSPVKSEASESEDCSAWVNTSAFTTQPRTFFSDYLCFSLNSDKRSAFSSKSYAYLSFVAVNPHTVIH